MPKPSVQPSAVSLRVLPGQVASAIVKLDQIPSDALVTASVANGNSLVLLKLVIAHKLIQRHTEPNYPKPGQILIHELTHAWQITNSSFLPGFICEGAVTGGKNYNYGPPFLTPGTISAPPWSSYGFEQQAAIVDQWFGGTRVGSNGPKDQDDPYFGYILNNIQLGQP